LLPSVERFERQHGTGPRGRSLAIRSKMRLNSSRGAATFAIWKHRVSAMADHLRADLHELLP
jgi:hypothetical protein